MKTEITTIEVHESSIKDSGSLATKRSTTLPKTPNNEASAMATKAVSIAIIINQGSRPLVKYRQNW